MTVMSSEVETSRDGSQNVSPRDSSTPLRFAQHDTMKWIVEIVL
jgi:hypothetical protein